VSAGDKVDDGTGILRDYGSYAMFDYGRILVAGGGSSTANTRSIDIRSGSAVEVVSGDMNIGRRQLNLTVLADGQVLATGGHSAGRRADGLKDSGGDGNLVSWKLAARMAKSRQYHSTALLLPDGRVVSGGQGLCDQSCAAEANIEIYSPPYLFNADGSTAARPVISSAPATATYGGSLQVSSAQASSIVKVHLVKPGSVTHSTNFTQRLIPLSFTVSGTTLNVTAPVNSNIAPPGDYMLFIVNAQGTPSVAKFVRFPIP
jgi:hypothetical protein